LQTRHIPASRFPFIAQREESDCGLAALAMVAMSHGVPVSDSIYQQAGELPEHGLSLLQLRNLARSVCLSAEAYRIDPEHLLDLVCPFIAHLNDGHFVVVCYADDHRAMIADPATSVHSITDEKLKEIWSGNVITVQLPAK
jgi:ABC-type bacteriocin/lantibiotic exporter with double-glycine peptidase domain